jgi:hypothetical protein
LIIKLNKTERIDWRIFTLIEVNIIYDLSHKLNDVGECQEVEFPTEIKMKDGILHTLAH